MRMTRQRKQILSVLSHSKSPQSAEMIWAKFPKGTLNLSTIYRTLDLFFAQNIISKSFMNNMTYFYINKHDHHHYMICMACQKMIEVDCKLADMAHEVATKHHFTITHHDMTIYGYCQKCQLARQ
jgi:Fur family transcriptional regulator, ferric uptake regulator